MTRCVDGNEELLRKTVPKSHIIIFDHICMSAEDYQNKIDFELGKIHEWIEVLKDIATTEKINRIECKRTLHDISSSLSLITQFSSLSPRGKSGSKKFKDALDEVDKHRNHIEGVARNIENETNWKEQLLRTTLFEISHNCRQIVLGIDLVNLKRRGFSAISSIGSFTANRSLKLTEPWVIANCYLTAIDVTVNRRRAEFKIAHPTEKKEMNTPFDQRYKELVDEMKKQGYVISEILGPLANSFWDMRTNVIHYGFTPNQKELQLIVDYSKDILKMLLAPKPK